MKIIVFSLLSILVSTYAVMVDKEDKAYLHDDVQTVNHKSYHSFNKQKNMLRSSKAEASDASK